MVQIREFQISDYVQVIALWEASGLEVGPSDSREAICHKIERDADLFLVAQDAKRIVGAVMGAYDGRRGWIYHIAVAPTWRYEGLGRSLMVEVEERLRALGCIKVNLLIEPANAKVQGFYERLEYTEDKLIFMEKWID